MSRDQPRHEERIVVDPNIMVGKPVVKGTRIPVERVLKAPRVESGPAGLFAAYPQLTLEDVKARLALCRGTGDIGEVTKGVRRLALQGRCDSPQTDTRECVPARRSRACW